MNTTIKVIPVDTPTVNNRVYPNATIQKAIDDVRLAMTERRFFGTIYKHSEITQEGWDTKMLPFSRVSHLVTDLRIEAGYLVADIETMGTGNGKLLESFLQIPGRLLPTPVGNGTLHPRGPEPPFVEVYHLLSVSFVMVD